MEEEDVKNCYNGEEKAKPSIFSINRFMLPSKIAFLLIGGVLGSHIPFLNIFFTSVGLTPSQAGFITGFRFLPSTLFFLFWGALVDLTGRRKLILVLLCLGTALPIFSMPWVAYWINSHHTNKTCLELLANNTNTITKEPCIEQTNFLFSILLLIMVVATLFSAYLPAYIDAVIMNVVKSCKHTTSFGWQRTFSSLGIGVMNFAAGVAADYYKYPGMSKYSAVFIMFVVCTLLLIPSGCLVIDQTTWEKKKGDKVKLRHIMKMFRRVDVIMFMCTSFVAGLGCMLYYNFVFLLINDEFKCTKTQMSLVVVVSSISEIFALSISSKVIKWIRITPSIMVGLFAYFARFALMSYATNIWVVIASQILHGIGFCLSFVAMMEYIHKISPKEVNMTMNAILQAVHFGFSAFVANVLGGRIYEHYGGRMLFRVMAIMSIAWAFVLLLYNGPKVLDFLFKRDDESTKVKFSEYHLEIGVDNEAKEVAL